MTVHRPTVLWQVRREPQLGLVRRRRPRHRQHRVSYRSFPRRLNRRRSERPYFTFAARTVARSMMSRRSPPSATSAGCLSDGKRHWKRFHANLWPEAGDIVRTHPHLPALGSNAAARRPAAVPMPRGPRGDRWFTVQAPIDYPTPACGLLARLVIQVVPRIPSRRLPMGKPRYENGGTRNSIAALALSAREV